MHEPHQTLRLYYWVPRSEVVYLQAVLDAYEGLCRVRTERHENERSLIVCLTPSSRASELVEMMQMLSSEISGPLEPAV